MEYFYAMSLSKYVSFQICLFPKMSLSKYVSFQICLFPNIWARCFYRISFSAGARHLCANTQLIFYCGWIMPALTGSLRYFRGHHDFTHGIVWCDAIVNGTRVFRSPDPSLLMVLYNKSYIIYGTRIFTTFGPWALVNSHVGPGWCCRLKLQVKKCLDQTYSNKRSFRCSDFRREDITIIERF